MTPRKTVRINDFHYIIIIKEIGIALKCKQNDTRLTKHRYQNKFITLKNALVVKNCLPQNSQGKDVQPTRQYAHQYQVDKTRKTGFAI